MHLATFRSECTKLSGAHTRMTMGARQDDTLIGTEGTEHRLL